MLAGRNALEDPWQEPSQDMFTRSVSPEQAPDKPTYLEIEFEKGDPVALDGEKLSPATLLAQLNKVRTCLKCGLSAGGVPTPQRTPALCECNLQQSSSDNFLLQAIPTI